VNFSANETQKHQAAAILEQQEAERQLIAAEGTEAKAAREAVKQANRIENG